MKTKVGIPDIILCSAAVIIAAAILVFQIPEASGKNMQVFIKSDSADTVYPLEENRTVEIQSAGHTITVEIKDGAVRVKDSDCPDKYCVSSGWIKDSSRPVVCAPGKTVIRIQNGGGDGDADFIAG